MTNQGRNSGMSRLLILARQGEEELYTASSEAHSRELGQRSAIGVETVRIERRTPAIAVMKRHDGDNRDRAQAIDAGDSSAVHECARALARKFEHAQAKAVSATT
jgi:hypothetical protein